MFIAATHNGISRLYETFGNGGADTLERTLSPSEYQRTWYKQNPPLPKAKWSQRNNNNYEQSALLTSLYYFGNNSKLFLKNFYLKSKRSIEKPKNEGPAAYVLPANDPRLGNQAELLRTLQAQGVEISKSTAAFTVQVRKKSAPAAAAGGARPAATASPSPASKTEDRTFPAGSYIIRMIKTCAMEAVGSCLQAMKPAYSTNKDHSWREQKVPCGSKVTVLQKVIGISRNKLVARLWMGGSELEIYIVEKIVTGITWGGVTIVSSRVGSGFRQSKSKGF